MRPVQHPAHRLLTNRQGHTNRPNQNALRPPQLRRLNAKQLPPLPARQLRSQPPASPASGRAGAEEGLHAGPARDQLDEGALAASGDAHDHSDPRCDDGGEGGGE